MNRDEMFNTSQKEAVPEEKTLQDITDSEIRTALEKIEATNEEIERMQKWLKKEKKEEFIKLFLEAVRAEGDQEKVQKVIDKLVEIRETADETEEGADRAKNAMDTIEIINVLSKRLIKEILIYIEFEKVIAGGKEVMLSKKISPPLNFGNAVIWCLKKGGRLPEIEELEALYRSGNRDSFKGMVFWSATYNEQLHCQYVFDFKDGRKEIRTHDEELNVTRAVI